MQLKASESTAVTSLENIIDAFCHAITDVDFQNRCKQTLDENGVLVLPSFLTAQAIDEIARHGEKQSELAYYTQSSHNIYLAPDDPAFSDHHPRNRQISSSKGCITTDQIPADCSLHTLYHNAAFKRFLCAVLDEKELHEYADTLSSINLHYAAQGQELGWHFDNSSFAITLLIQKPEAGATFEYVKDVRDADNGDMNFEQAGKILDGDIPVQSLSMEAGDLVLFRGRNSIHRVTPTQGDITRMLVVLAYNAQADITLSESARKTFYGRLN